MSKTTFAIGFAALLLVSACSKKAQEVSATSNWEIPIELLFEKDGCKVYRFEDGGRDHYYTTCEGSVSADWSESCGKNCRKSHSEENQTTRRQPREPQ